MSVQRNRRGELVFVCDHCEGELETEVIDFDRALDIARDNGWRYIKDEKENVCSGCRD